MKKDVKVIHDLDSIKICIEDTRSKILSLLRVNDMTISQLAEALNKDQSTIYRHIKKLEEAGFVIVSGERKVHHIPEKKYGRTAGIFLLAPKSMESKGSPEIALEWERKQVEKIVNILKMVGYDCEEDEEVISDLTELFAGLTEKVKLNLDNIDEEVGEITFPTLFRLQLILSLLEIENDDEFQERMTNILSSFEG